MAHFRGTVKGNRTEASRLGHKATGLEVEANGWTGGVRVELAYNEKTGQDVALVTLSGGSGGVGPHVTIYSGPIDAETREAVLRGGKFWGGEGR